MSEITQTGMYRSDFEKEARVREMTRDEYCGFMLSGTRTAKLATVRRDGSPHVAPVWFVLDGDDIIFTTGKDTVKGKNILRDGRVGICVDDEEPPFRFAMAEGEAEATLEDPDMLPRGGHRNPIPRHNEHPHRHRRLERPRRKRDSSQAVKRLGWRRFDFRDFRSPTATPPQVRRTAGNTEVREPGGDSTLPASGISVPRPPHLALHAL